MLAQFERKVVYLSDNATQTQIKMTENIVEIKKILKSKMISNDQELIQSDPTSCLQNQKGKN